MKKFFPSEIAASISNIASPLGQLKKSPEGSPGRKKFNTITWPHITKILGVNLEFCIKTFKDNGDLRYEGGKELFCPCPNRINIEIKGHERTPKKLRKLIRFHLDINNSGQVFTK